MTITDQPIIYRGCRISVRQGEFGFVGCADRPDDATIGAGFIMGSKAFTHSYPDEKQALDAAIAIVDTREFWNAR